MGPVVHITGIRCSKSKKNYQPFKGTLQPEPWTASTGPWRCTKVRPFKLKMQRKKEPSR